MPPEIIKNLIENADVRILLGFIQNEIDKLDHLSDIEVAHPNIIAVKVIGRQEAQKVLKRILEPFLNLPSGKNIGPSNKDFVM